MAGNRSPGRPQSAVGAELEARGKLIDTAARLFAEGTSLRQVAEGADVTPALISYYFKDKSGLQEAVVREGLSTLLAVVRSVVEEEGDGDFIERLIRRYLETLVRLPWIPRIVLREVISKDTPLRKLFTEEFAVHAATLVPEKVGREILAGRLRSDLDPRFAILSLMGMCLFPFFSYPVLGPLLGFELNEEFAEHYREHTIELFLNGAGVSS